MPVFFIFTLCIKAFQLSSSIRQELDLLLMYSTISPIKKDINVPIETNKLSLSPNDSMKIENVNVKLLYNNHKKRISENLSRASTRKKLMHILGTAKS